MLGDAERKQQIQPHFPHFSLSCISATQKKSKKVLDNSLEPCRIVNVVIDNDSMKGVK
jgi:hypothetical protein